MQVCEFRFEAKHECKTRHLKSVGVDGRVDNTEYSHHVLEVLLKSGESYVVDMTGAQYGFHRAIVPSDEHMRIVRAVAEIMEFGNAKKFIQQPLGKRNLDDLIRRYYEDMELGFEAALAEALILAGGLTLSKLIRLPEPAFREKRAQILKDVQSRMRIAAGVMDTITVKRLAARHRIKL